MKIIVVDDYEQMSDKSAELLGNAVKSDPNATLGLATGSTPLGTYARLVEACACGEISFAAVRTCNLDEYVGLNADNVNSYAHYMRENLFDKIDINIDNTHLPNGAAQDLDAECARYTELLESIPQDIQLLGLGSDGHIGFNEPYSPFDGHTHVVTLAESTVKDNSRLFSHIDEVPRKAITMGIADIMRARKILILASGANKAQAVYDMIKGEINEACPASVLQRHPDVTVVLDKSAAALL